VHRRALRLGYTPDSMEGKLVMVVTELEVGIVLPPRWKAIMLMSGRFSSHVGTITLIQIDMQCTDLVVLVQSVEEFGINIRHKQRG
jgi:hypothetical protein